MKETVRAYLEINQKQLFWYKQTCYQNIRLNMLKSKKMKLVSFLSGLEKNHDFFS